MNKSYLWIALAALTFWTFGCGNESTEIPDEAASASTTNAHTAPAAAETLPENLNTQETQETQSQELGPHPALAEYSEEPLRVGETRKSTNGSLKMTLVQLHDPGESTVSFIPDEGERLVTVVLELENTDPEGDVAYSPASFRLVDNHGTEYEPTIRPTPDPVLNSTTLQSKGKVTGAFSFVLPNSGGGLMMTYVPYLGFPPELVFNLQQP